MSECKHGRIPEHCIRCDPWCPPGQTNEWYDEMQRCLDGIRAAHDKLAPYDPDAIPAGTAAPKVDE